MAVLAPRRWLRGIVKAVPSWDSLLIMGMPKGDVIPPEKTITLSSLIAPRLARRGGLDEPFAWESREFLRKLCAGKDVTFRVDYVVQTIGREFATVFVGDQNVGFLVVAQGWAKYVREQGQQKGEASPDLEHLLLLKEQAKQQGLGKWSEVSGASEASIRDLPLSVICSDPTNFDAFGFVNENKGKSIATMAEQVRDGSTIQVYFLPDFQFAQIFVAGIQSPSMGRRPAPDTVVQTDRSVDQSNGETAA